MKEIKKHGGARKGAGRKPTGKSPQISIYLTPDMRELGLDTPAKVKEAALNWARQEQEKSSK